jgi:hypothetical protein
MYFVTTKVPGYVMFSMTPSERAAFAVTEDQQHVHVLERTPSGWKVHRDFPMNEHSHTQLMTRLANVEEPATVDELVRLALRA